MMDDARGEPSSWPEPPAVLESSRSVYGSFEMTGQDSEHDRRYCEQCGLASELIGDFSCAKSLMMYNLFLL